METWLKWLIAAACCVVILGGAALAWDRFSMYQREQQALEHRESEQQRSANVAAQAKCREAIHSASQQTGYDSDDAAAVSDLTKLADRCLLQYPELQSVADNLDSALESVNRKKRLQQLRRSAATGNAD